MNKTYHKTPTANFGCVVYTAKTASELFDKHKIEPRHIIWAQISSKKIKVGVL